MIIIFVVDQKHGWGEEMTPFKIQQFPCQKPIIGDIHHVGMNKFTGHGHYHIQIYPDSVMDLVFHEELVINVASKESTNFNPYDYKSEEDS